MAREDFRAFAAHIAAGSPPKGASIALHVIDTLGALLAGARTAEGGTLRQALAPGGNLPQGPAAAGLHAALARLTEIDDIHLASCTTPGSAVVPAALDMAAALGGRSAGDVLRAAELGYEAMIRLGRAIDGAHVVYSQVWPSYFCAAFGTAAATAALLELPEEKAEDALALALSVSAGGSTHGSGRWFSFGQACRAGCEAALAAASGVRGDTAVFEPRWFTASYGLGLEPKDISADLGERSAVDEVSLKPFCGAKQTVGAVDALERLRQEGLPPEDVRAVEVTVPPFYKAMIDHGAREGDRTSTITSAAYQMALALYAPESLYDVERLRLSEHPAIGAFVAKVSVHADGSLAAHYPGHWPARVHVMLADGRSLQAETIAAAGDPERPFSRADLERKWHLLLDPLYGNAAAAEQLMAAAAFLDGALGVSAFAREIGYAAI